MNIKLLFKTTKAIYFGMLFSIMFFGSVIYFITPKEVWSYSFSSESALLPVGILLSIITPFFSNWLYKKNLNNISTEISLNKKLIDFQKYSIQRYAIIEGTILFNLAIAFLLHTAISWLLGLVLLCFFYTFSPTKEKVIRDLNLNPKEQNDFLRELE